MAGELELRRDTDSWTDMLPAVGDLAVKVAGTEFVPAALRGKPAAVAAAILTGREIGIPPMQSLSSIHVVDGRPTLSAELMRQLVFAAGHRIRYVETTNTRCIVEGWRVGSESADATVTWSMDDAKRAGLDGKANWRKHTRQMLIARATAELCRMVFPDVIGGLAYTSEELTDGGVVDAELVEPTTTPARRTARRRNTPTPPTAVSVAAEPAQPAPAVDEPPLDDPEPAQAVDEAPAEPPATRAQLTKLHALFGDVGWTDRDDRLRAAAAIVARPLGSSSDLTKAEAHLLIDTLEQVAARPDPATALTDLLEATGDVVDAEVVGESS